MCPGIPLVDKKNWARNTIQSDVLKKLYGIKNSLQGNGLENSDGTTICRLVLVFSLV